MVSVLYCQTDGEVWPCEAISRTEGRIARVPGHHPRGTLAADNVIAIRGPLLVARAQHRGDGWRRNQRDPLHRGTGRSRRLHRAHRSPRRLNGAPLGLLLAAVLAFGVAAGALLTGQTRGAYVGLAVAALAVVLLLTAAVLHLRTIQYDPGPAAGRRQMVTNINHLPTLPINVTHLRQAVNQAGKDRG